MATDVNDQINVRLYDGAESKVSREEVYKIHPEKFELDVRFIVKCEDQWVGQAVVAKNVQLGLFQLGNQIIQIVNFYEGDFMGAVHI